MLAVIGVGLLAVWTMVSNITASLFIWIWRPYELGETIEMLPNNVKGRAVDRSLMFTTLREADGTLLMIPNNQFFQNVIRRWPNKTGVTDYEAWEAERNFGSAEYVSHPASPNPAIPDSTPKDDVVT
jgi:small-conductance mechanosensitive channel